MSGNVNCSGCGVELSASDADISEDGYVCAQCVHGKPPADDSAAQRELQAATFRRHGMPHVVFGCVCLVASLGLGLWFVLSGAFGQRPFTSIGVTGAALSFGFTELMIGMRRLAAARAVVAGGDDRALYHLDAIQ